MAASRIHDVRARGAAVVSLAKAPAAAAAAASSSSADTCSSDLLLSLLRLAFSALAANLAARALPAYTHRFEHSFTHPPNRVKGNKEGVLRVCFVARPSTRLNGRGRENYERTNAQN
jgi:hypothetical protein